MTQQDIHPDPTRTRPEQGAIEQATEQTTEQTTQNAEPTAEQTRSHEWLGYLA